jgi:hypothetical protein
MCNSCECIMLGRIVCATDGNGKAGLSASLRPSRAVLPDARRHHVRSHDPALADLAQQAFDYWRGLGVDGSWPLHRRGDALINHGLFRWRRRLPSAFTDAGEVRCSY